MIDEILDINLVKECTLVEATSKEAEYEGNTYKLHKLGTAVRFLDKLTEEEMIKHLKHRLYISFFKEAEIEVTKLIEAKINKRMILTKENKTTLCTGTALCNETTAEKLKHYNIVSTNLVIANCIEDNKIYVLDLKDILILYNSNIEIGNLEDLYEDIAKEDEEENIITKYISIYANFCLDRNKDVKIVEIEIKE